MPKGMEPQERPYEGACLRSARMTSLCPPAESGPTSISALELLFISIVHDLRNPLAQFTRASKC
jgi:hypothetical protein